ncbi:MAG: 50S ribosomal protein L23 [Planctomycetaceae bacterium]|jgi:large subunit ribosomal protein L23|nr:50S ribosomal protein L23 [Planctomycetaceae bacterium]
MPRQKDITKVNLQLEPYQVILKPVVTEKGYDHAEHRNIYTFEVNGLANKQQIKKAVEFLFEVKVLDVRTQKRRGKKRRVRRTIGKTATTKRALVRLHEDDKINYG